MIVEPVDDEVVDDPAVGIAQHRVLRLANDKGTRIAHHRVTQDGDGLLAGDLELAHVREVEQADGGSDGAVLLDDRAVLHRHLIAGEGHHSGSELDVEGMKRGPAQLARGGCGHALASADTTLPVSGPRRIATAASSTTERSVAWLRSAIASGRSTQRTSSNSASWASVLPPIGRIRKKWTVLWNRVDPRTK